LHTTLPGGAWEREKAKPGSEKELSLRAREVSRVTRCLTSSAVSPHTLSFPSSAWECPPEALPPWWMAQRPVIFIHASSRPTPARLSLAHYATRRSLGAREGAEPESERGVACHPVSHLIRRFTPHTLVPKLRLFLVSKLRLGMPPGGSASMVDGTTTCDFYSHAVATHTGKAEPCILRYQAEPGSERKRNLGARKSETWERGKKTPPAARGFLAKVASPPLDPRMRIRPESSFLRVSMKPGMASLPV